MLLWGDIKSHNKKFSLNFPQSLKENLWFALLWYCLSFALRDYQKPQIISKIYDADKCEKTVIMFYLLNPYG